MPASLGPVTMLIVAQACAASSVNAFLSAAKVQCGRPSLSGFSSSSPSSVSCRTTAKTIGFAGTRLVDVEPLRLRGGSYEVKGRGGPAKSSRSPSQHTSPAHGPSSWASIASQTTRGSPSPVTVSEKLATPASSSFSAASQVNPPAPKHPDVRKAKRADSPTVLKAHAEGAPAETVDASAATPEEPADDAYYFNSYSHFGIHEEMLKDEVRTHGYRDALIKNSHLLQGKTVLDVGCGTGILSMFAVQAGAKHVYAVDNSDMAYTAKEIVRVNGFEDKITVIKGDIETIDLPVDKVDVIISEWMGYCLLYEAMLDTVLIARDRWLAPGGIMMPDKATMFITAIEDAKYKQEKIYFWDQVYGFNMSLVKNSALSEPLVDTVDPHQIAASTAMIWDADLMTVTKADLVVNSSFLLTASRNDYIHALVVHFDVGFTKLHKPLWISTSPRERSTHWRQTVIYLHDELCIKKGETINGHLRITPNTRNKRHLDIKLKYSFNGEAVNGVLGVKHDACHFYKMS